MTTMRKRWLIGAALLSVMAVAALLLIFRVNWSGRPEALSVNAGWRAIQVYDAADKALGVAEGTTRKAAAKAARSGSLKLPPRAKGNPEGYLYPATYPIDDETTPASLLADMVDTANRAFRRHDADAYDTVTVASLAQAEADTPENMGKVARVIRNRIDAGMPLQMDSTINYALRRSTLNTTHADTRSKSPYNTYRYKGLPPSPISSPGADALSAAARPPRGDWLYFVTVKPGDTRFTDSYRQHQKYVEEFNRNQASQGGS